ncbi:hypothetical protein KY290_025154 [Solanum tuberosum]|uniref:Uncharacterized protein n=3 Tax=Solanum TaxID=4107 RepID=A0ABQ7UUJ6_SOLTU|nr:hypothetical protein KY290_025154 [Solanum tuberosum]
MDSLFLKLVPKSLFLMTSRPLLGLLPLSKLNPRNSLCFVSGSTQSMRTTAKCFWHAKQGKRSILFPKVKCYCTEPKLHALLELQSLSSDSELTEWLHLNE